MSKGEETRQAIVRRAAMEAARVGLTGLSLGHLAREMDLSKSGLFAHFASKEALEVAILDEGAEEFTEHVVRPALRAPRGEPRLRALFERWTSYLREERKEVGCLFIAASAELDDRPGPVRERLVSHQRDLLDLVANVARTGVTEGQFRRDLDAEQLASEFYGILLAWHHGSRLMKDPRAFARARRALDRLIEDARAGAPGAAPAASVRR